MKKYMYIIKKNKYCLILALFILSFYLGRGVCALAKNTGKNTNSTVIVIDPGQQKKAEKAKKYKYAEFVTLTRDEYAKLCAEYSEEGAKRMIEILDNYKGSKGKKYSSDYRAILNWVVNRYNEEIQKYGYKHKESASKDPGSATGNDYRNTI